jgi:predicted nucleic acid-binding protein
MKKISAYVDTSVFGGIFDEEFKRASNTFFHQVTMDYFDVYISPLVRNEISLAPLHVQNFFLEIFPYLKSVEVTEEALNLRDSYLASKIVSKKYTNDALHVALATVSGYSFIISWNFKHIVNYEKIALYNAINLSEGYRQISIYSPLEVVSHEKEF